MILRRHLLEALRSKNFVQTRETDRMEQYNDQDSGMESRTWRIATEADSLDELYTLIPESINLLMVDLAADNELGAFFAEKGWSTTAQSKVATDPMILDMPWLLAVESEHENKRVQP